MFPKYCRWDLVFLCCSSDFYPRTTALRKSEAMSYQALGSELKKLSLRGLGTGLYKLCLSCKQNLSGKLHLKCLKSPESLCASLIECKSTHHKCIHTNQDYLPRPRGTRRLSNTQYKAEPTMAGPRKGGREATSHAYQQHPVQSWGLHWDKKGWQRSSQPRLSAAADILAGSHRAARKLAGTLGEFKGLGSERALLDSVGKASKYRQEKLEKILEFSSCRQRGGDFGKQSLFTVFNGLV